MLRPHEPFFSHRDHHRHYPAPAAASESTAWPDYKRVEEDSETVRRTRAEYAVLLTMCDASLGRVLDVFDEWGLWDDTLLIVCTDHGFLLGEHGWWGKNVQPWYDENIHTPLFLWDPVARTKAGTCRELVQTIDFGPTLLDFFGLQPTADMQGRSLLPLLRHPAPDRHRVGALFGVFGGHVNVTDGRYVYLRAPAAPGNAPLFEHTLMLRMIDLLLDLMRANDAPDSQFLRLGLPLDGKADSRHLLAEQTASSTLLELAAFSPVLTRRTLYRLDRALAESRPISRHPQ